MNLFRSRARGRLTGGDLDTLVRWSLGTGVEEAGPSPEVWQNIVAGAHGQRRAQARLRRRWQTAAWVGTLPAAGLAALVRYLHAWLRARERGAGFETWRAARPPLRPAFDLDVGLFWFAFSPHQQLY